MFQSKIKKNKIIKLHQRALRLVYDNETIRFEDTGTLCRVI